MTVKMGFLAHSPAAANSLKPIMDVLKDNPDIEINMYAYHEYVKNLWGCFDIIKEKSYPEELKDMDIVVYGTGSGNDIETGTSKFCKDNGIISVSILDLPELPKDNIVMRFPTAPDYIITPSEKLKRECKQLFPGTDIFNFGNPHYDRLASFIGKYKVKTPMTIGFFSQCSGTGDYSDTMDGSKEVLKRLNTYARENPHMVSEIIIAPHPRENISWLKSEVEDSQSLMKFSTIDSTSLMISVDIVTGHTCTLQHEAKLIGKPNLAWSEDTDEYMTNLAEIKDQNFKPLIETVYATEANKAFLLQLVALTKCE